MTRTAIKDSFDCQGDPGSEPGMTYKTEAGMTHRMGAGERPKVESECAFVLFAVSAAHLLDESSRRFLGM